MVMLVRLVQLKNAESPIVVTDAGMVMLTIVLRSKAAVPMDVTVDGRVTAIGLVRLVNALGPMVASELGKEMLVRLAHPLKQSGARATIPAGMAKAPTNFAGTCSKVSVAASTSAPLITGNCVLALVIVVKLGQ